MATYIRIKIRRGSTKDWETANPKLELGEIGADMTKHRLKVGDGTSLWNALPYIGPEVINDLLTGGTEAALSAEQGKTLKTLVDGKASKSDLTALETQITQIIQNGGVTVEDKLTSTSKTNALSANMGRELNEKLKGIGIFGMGYTVDSFNTYGRPAKITFQDGVTCDLVWSGGTILDRIIASTGEVMEMKYNTSGTIIGRKVTRPDDN